MQTKPGRHLAMQQFEHALSDPLRIGMGDPHRVLGGIAIAQPRTTSHLDERRETRPCHTGLRLVQRPGVEHRIHAVIGALALEVRELILPMPAQCGERLVHITRIGVLLSHPFALFGAGSDAQHENAASLLSRLHGVPLVQDAAVIAAQLAAA